MINVLLPQQLDLRRGAAKHLYKTHMRSITYSPIPILFYRHLLLATDLGTGHGDRHPLGLAPYNLSFAGIIGKKRGCAQRGNIFCFLQANL